MNPSTVIISGASGELGLATTYAFLNAGWRVHAACRSTASAERLRSSVSSQSAAALSLQLNTHLCDVSVESQAQEFVAAVIDASPSGIHALLCLAGGIQAGTEVEITNASAVDVMLTQNLKTAWYLAAAALPLLKKQGGSIVTIGARAASPDRPAEARKSAYAASKAALIALTRTIAEEGRPFGVRANCIVPGILKTPANLIWGEPDEIQHWTEPADVAAMMLHLCSDAGKAISGAILPMYAGLA